MEKKLTVVVYLLIVNVHVLSKVGNPEDLEVEKEKLVKEKMTI